MVNEGVTGAITDGLPILMTIGAFFAISLYNVLELTFMIFTTFRRYRGLYFWSLVVATWGIAPHSVGFILKFFRLIPSTDFVAVAMVAIGWWPMVTGQSMVLYSRLHLVLHDRRWLRWVLYLIIFDAFVMGTPLIILAFGSNSTNPAPYVGIYTTWDKLQLVVFFAQEFGISLLYIYSTIRLLKPSANINQKALRQLLVHLVLVNVMVLVLDVTLLVVQFSGHYEIQTSYKAAIYSVKLKIEFSVLNRLIELVKHEDGVAMTVESSDLSSGAFSGVQSYGSESKIGATGHDGCVRIVELEQSAGRTRSSMSIVDISPAPRVMVGVPVS